MAKELPDLHKVLDRLFSKSGEKPTVAGQALFDRPDRRKKRGADSDSRAVSAPSSGIGHSGTRKEKRPLAGFMRWLAGASGPVVGLDLAASGVKLVRVEPGAGGSVRVSAAICREIPPDLAEAQRKGFLQQALREFRREGLLRGSVVMGVPEDQIAVEQAAMPKMPASDLEKAVEWEAKEKVAADPATHCIRHLLIGESVAEGKPQMDLLIFAVPREDVLAPYHLISEAGGKVAAAEPGILASVAALDAAGLFRPEEFVGVMDIGFRTSALAFVVNHKVRFVRSFSVAGDGATRSVAEYCKVDYAAAELQKREAGLPAVGTIQPPAAGGAGQDDMRLRAGQALTLYLEKLANEVDHSLRYVTYYTLQRGSGRRLDRLYLLGGGAQLRNLGPFLESRLGAEVQVADPFERVVLSEGGARQLPPGLARTRMASALGLALRG